MKLDNFYHIGPRPQALWVTTHSHQIASLASRSVQANPFTIWGKFPENFINYKIKIHKYMWPSNVSQETLRVSRDPQNSKRVWIFHRWICTDSFHFIFLLYIYIYIYIYMCVCVSVCARVCICVCVCKKIVFFVGPKREKKRFD